MFSRAKGDDQAQAIPRHASKAESGMGTTDEP